MSPMSDKGISRPQIGNYIHSLIIVLLVILDQFTKFLVSINMHLGESRPVFKNIFHITLVHNSGIAFGLFKGMVLLLIFISIAAILFILLCAGKFRYSHRYVKLGLLFILSGAIGNLIDRIRLGYVIDFIDLRIWPVFNIADFLITIGGIFLIWHLLFLPREKKGTDPFFQAK